MKRSALVLSSPLKFPPMSRMLIILEDSDFVDICIAQEACERIADG